MPGFTAPKAAERRFVSQLRKVARIVSGIIDPHVDGAQLHNEAAMVKALRAYSEALGPWADRVVSAMLGHVERDNLKAWTKISEAMGKELKSTWSNSQVGKVATALHRDQVDKIKTLPLDAAERAQSLARAGQVGGTRATQVAEALANTEQVTGSAAVRLARTEVAKASAALTQARAAAVGVDNYVWRTALDGDVRPSHAEMEGQVCSFSDPPEVGDEGAHGPGEIYNCRCYAEPIVPGDGHDDDPNL